MVLCDPKYSFMWSCDPPSRVLMEIQGIFLPEARLLAMTTSIDARNKNALRFFTEEEKMNALLRMVKTASIEDASPRCCRSILALTRALERLRPEEIRAPGGFDARSLMQTLVDNGEDGEVLLRRLERHCLHMATVFDWFAPFIPHPVNGILHVSHLPKLCAVCLEVRNLMVIPFDWNEGPASELKAILESICLALGEDVRPTFVEMQRVASEEMMTAMDVHLRVTLRCPMLKKDLRQQRGFLGKHAGGPKQVQQGYNRAFILEPHVQCLDGPAKPPLERMVRLQPEAVRVCDDVVTSSVEEANRQAHEARRCRRAGGGVTVGVVPNATRFRQAGEKAVCEELSRARRRSLGAAQARLHASRLAAAQKQAAVDAAFLRATEAASFAKISARPVSEGGPSVEEVEHRLGAFLASQSKAAKHRAKREAKKLSSLHDSVVRQLFLCDDGEMKRPVVLGT
jgi:hypothetical protein